MGRDRFVALDSWRGIAALCVALFHINAPSHVAAIPLIQQGGYFIVYFFVLSGFLMAGAYGSRLGTGNHVLQFLVRRFGRLYPLHIFVLALYFLWSAWALGSPFAENGPASLGLSLLMMNGLGLQEGFGWNPPSWSISTEFAAYLVFALVVAISGKWRVAGYGSALLVALTGLYFSTPADQWHRDLIFTCTNGFFVGAIGWHVYLALKDRLDRLPAWAMTALEVLALAAFAYVMFWPFRSFVEGRYFAPIYMLPTVIVFAAQRGALSALLTLPPFMFLGTLSYSVYLVHDLIIRATWGHIDGLVNSMAPGLDVLWLGDIKYAVFTALVIGCATVTFRIVEEPSRLWFRELADRLGRRHATA